VSRCEIRIMRESSTSASNLPRVLHVTESFGGGVGNAVLDYVASTPEFEHHLLYAERADSPIPPESLKPFLSIRLMDSGHAGGLRSTVRLMRSGAWDIVHAHSSFGGVYARLALGGSQKRLVYTPHCYAFERRDVGLAARLLFALAERALRWRTDVFAACAPREAALSSGWPSRPVVYVPNIASSDEVSWKNEQSERSPLFVFGAGRDAPQKDPDYFLACVRALRESGLAVRAAWLGGSEALRARFAPENISVTGWLSRAEVMRLMADGGIYIHTAAWEGFPVAILEAAKIGVPTLARSIPAYAGLAIPQFDSPAQLAEKLTEIDSQDKLLDLVDRSRQALRFNSPEHQRAALLRAYGASFPSRPQLRAGMKGAWLSDRGDD